LGGAEATTTTDIMPDQSASLQSSLRYHQVQVQESEACYQSYFLANVTDDNGAAAIERTCQGKRQKRKSLNKNKTTK